MKTKYDALAELATKAIEHSDNIGEEAWYGPGELRDLGRIGIVHGGASRIGAADDEYIVACEPAAILGLIADVKALAEALNAIDDAARDDDACLPESPTWQAIEAARAALALIQGEAAPPPPDQVLSLQQRKEFTRRMTFISNANRDEQMGLVEEIERAVLNQLGAKNV